MSFETYTKLWSNISEELVATINNNVSVRSLFQNRNPKLLLSVLRENFLSAHFDHPCHLSEELKGDLRNLLAEIETASTTTSPSNFRNTEFLSVNLDLALTYQERERLQKQASVWLGTSVTAQPNLLTLIDLLPEPPNFILQWKPL